MCTVLPACSGAIVNLWFPNWLLALLWVTAMTASNIELLLSFVRYIQVKREARSIAQQLRLVSPPASAPGTAAAAAAIAGGVTKSSSVELSSRAAAVSAAPTTNGATTTTNDVQQAHDAAAVAASTSGSMSRSEMVRQQGELLTKAQKLAKEAHKIEARALLYPTLYVPDVGRALEVGVVVLKGGGWGRVWAKETGYGCWKAADWGSHR